MHEHVQHLCVRWSLSHDPSCNRCHASLQPAAAFRAAAARGVLEGGLALGRWAGGMRGPLQTAARSARLARILDGGETLRLQYPREDLGFAYTGPGAAVRGDDPAAVLPRVSARRGQGGNAAADARGRAAPYVPSTAPGARLPHAVVTLRSPGARPYKHRSTLQALSGLRPGDMVVG